MGSRSPLWIHLRETYGCEAWREFFGVCDRLLQQLEPFDRAIVDAERKLKPLSLIELLSYLSVLAYSRLNEANNDSAGMDWIFVPFSRCLWLDATVESPKFFDPKPRK